MGLVILYSASNQNTIMLEKQAMRLVMAFGVMIAFAQIPPRYYYLAAPILFSVGVTLLVSVLLFGEVNQGARRWINLGFFRF